MCVYHLASDSTESSRQETRWEVKQCFYVFFKCCFSILETIPSLYSNLLTHLVQSSLTKWKILLLPVATHSRLWMLHWKQIVVCWYILQPSSKLFVCIQSTTPAVRSCSWEWPTSMLSGTVSRLSGLSAVRSPIQESKSIYVTFLSEQLWPHLHLPPPSLF